MSKTADAGQHSDETPIYDVKTYKFTVDDRPFESDQPTLTGAQIKARASVDPNFGLFLEGLRNRPDERISDDQTVDLTKPGREKFYTAPPATFGASR